MRTRQAWLLACILSTGVAAELTGDVNQDGHVDVADLVLTANMAAGLTAPSDRADLDQDGLVTDADVVLLREQLVAAEPEARLPVAEAVVGAGGNVIGNAHFAVDIPAGALATDRRVTIDLLPETQPFESESDTPLYEIDGLGTAQNGTVNIRFKGAARGLRSVPPVVVGEYLIPHSSNRPTWFYYICDGDDEVSVDGDDVVLHLPPPAMNSQRGPTRAVDLSDYRLRVSLLPTVWNKYYGTRFTIYYPFVLRLTDIENLATGLELAYERFLEPGTGFVYPAGMRTQVTVRALEGGMEGEVTAPSFYSSYHGYMNINSTLIRNRPLMRIVAMHEFLHVVQGFYGTSYKTMWLDEATSTWSEGRASPDPGQYCPTVFQSSLDAAFGHWHKQPYFSWGWKKGGADEHGYGMSILFHYLVDCRPDGSAAMIRRIYEQVRSGSHLMSALIAETPGGDFAAMRHDFFKTWMTDGLYGFTMGNMSGSSETVRNMPFVVLDTPEKIAQGEELKLTIPDLGATLVELAVDTDSLAPEAVIRAHLEGTYGHLLAFSRRGSKTTFLKAGDICGSNQWVVDTPGAHALLNPFDMRKFRSLNSFGYTIINDRAIYPYDGKRDFTFRLAVSQPYEFIPQELTLDGMFLNTYNINCPDVSIGGSFSGAFTSNIVDAHGTYGGKATMKHVQAKLVRPLPQTIRLKINLEMVKARTEISRDHYLEGRLGDIYLFKYMSWDELDISNLNSATRVYASGVNITVTESKPIYHATAYVMVHYKWAWTGVSYTWSILRPVLNIQFYATDSPHVMPEPP